MNITIMYMQALGNSLEALERVSAGKHFIRVLYCLSPM